MMKRKVLSCLSALSVSWLLAACMPGLSDDTSLCLGRSSGGIPLSEGQTTEVRIRNILPRYLGTIGEVVVESGGVLRINGENRVDGCATKDTAGIDIHWMMMVIPAIDYEDLRRMVIKGAQRSDFGCLWGPIRKDKLNSRIVTVGDEYGNRLSFYHHEAKDGIVIDLCSECMFPFQLLDPNTPRWSYPLPNLEEIFPNLMIMQALDDNGDENPGLRSQSGTQSEG